MSPLLFVINIEYFSRILRNIGDTPQFHYHPRCKTVKLTYLCFANDLIMCCRGDFTSIYIMLQAFKLFSEASGLQANQHKSAFYHCGMKVEDTRRIQEVSSFAQSNMPFRYLGVAICSKRISATHCDGLIEKMICRIKVWSSGNLSYMARVILINSVP